MKSIKNRVAPYQLGEPASSDDDNDDDIADDTKSEKALLLSSKVKSIKNRVTPYQLGEPASSDNDDDDDDDDDDDNHTVDDVDDIDDIDIDDIGDIDDIDDIVDIDDIDETEVKLDGTNDIDAVETGSITETRKLPSPSSPASVITSNDTIFSTAEEAGATDSPSSKSKSPRRESPSSSKSRRKRLSDVSLRRRTGTSLFQRKSLPPQNTGGFPSSEDLDYEDCDSSKKLPTLRTRRRGSTGSKEKEGSALARSKEEKAKASCLDDNFLLRNLGPGQKAKRRGSTGSSVDGSEVREKLKDVSARQPVRAASRRSFTVNESSHGADDKQMQPDLTKKNVKLSRGSCIERLDGSFGNSSSPSSRNDKRSKGQQPREAESPDEQSGSLSTNIANSKEDSTDRPDRKDVVSKRRSKFVNQRNLKVAHIDRRSRRNVQDVGYSAPQAKLEQPRTAGTSGSISSLTQSTGFASKDDVTLSSGSDNRSDNMQRFASASNVRTCSGTRDIIRSRWQTLPKGEQNSSADDIPVCPEHDLSSMCSPGQALVKAKCERSTNMATTSSLYPDVLVPATPCKSTAGYVSELSNPDGLITPGTTASSKKGGLLQSRLRLLPVHTASGQSALPSPHSEVLTTPKPRANKENVLGISWHCQVPETPGVSIAVGQLDTPGGFVSELTNASSLLDSPRGSLLSPSSRGRLSAFMNGTQATLLHEGEYHQDQIPRMVRRHSLDSVSYIADSDIDASSHGQQHC